MRYLLAKAVRVWQDEGFASVIAKTKNKIIAKTSGPTFQVPSHVEIPHTFRTVSVKELLEQRWKNVRPIAHIKINRETDRLNLVTDSLNADSLFGGVATSLILATLYAKNNNMDLRIITRNTENNPKNFFRFLEQYKISPPQKVEFFSDFDATASSSKLKLEVSEQDIFLATSWWSADAISKTNLRKRFFYILQEVEPFFYPHGDDRLLCEATLANPNIDFIVNSKLLFDYYKDNHYTNITENGCYFEPAFPEHLFTAKEDTFTKKEKYTLFFYGRPNNLRNLFFTGLEYLDEALNSNILDKDKWNIVLAGADTPPFFFTNGQKPTVKGRMSWQEYSNLTSNVDLAFCLMCTPHPSYPPLDMAASGAVVLTNTFANKQKLYYSENIIATDLDLKSMLAGFEKAVELVQDNEQRKANYENDKITRSWESALTSTFEFINNKLLRI